MENAPIPTIETVTLNDGIKKNRGDYGVRVARPGYDALTCADSNLLFNSSWPIIQICKVIDFNKIDDYYYTYQNLSTGELTEERPAGMTELPAFYEDKDYLISREYAYYFIGYGITIIDNVRWRVNKFKRASHNMDILPMFYMSEWISNITGKMVITNVDLSVDITYPYTDSPTAFVGENKDYGIKSSSIFGENVEGLNSGAFSKLLYKVMTTEKSGTIIYQDGELIAKEIFWYPLGKNVSEEKISGVLEKYEFYTFLGLDYEVTIDESFRRSEYVFAMDSGMSYAVGATTSYQAPTTTSKTLVVVRSPMVSPEYEEVEINE